MPVPHPSLEVRALEASVTQAKLVKDLCLMFEALSRLFVHGVFKEFLPCCNVIRKDASSEDELAKVFTQDFEVEWNLLITGVCGIERRVRRCNEFLNDDLLVVAIVWG